jgi:hypothetical protein
MTYVKLDKVKSDLHNEFIFQDEVKLVNSQ